MRRVLAFSIVTLGAMILATSGGCRMCASPYDYCGPVVDSGDCGSGPGYTQGGARMDGEYYENGAAPEEINRPAPPQKMGTPTPAPTPSPAPFGTSAQKPNPYMRSSRY
jgi:hypothetical protein